MMASQQKKTAKRPVCPCGWARGTELGGIVFVFLVNFIYPNEKQNGYFLLFFAKKYATRVVLCCIAA
jgi:hypothetical protein